MLTSISTLVVCWKARVAFRVMKLSRCVMKLGHCVIVDESGNHVTFQKLNVRFKIKKIINPHNESLDCLCSSAIGTSKFVYF